MNYANVIKTKARYIGKFLFEKDSIVFVTPHVGSTGRIKQKFFVSLGDIVYFLFLNGVLIKIGKAAGTKGWYGRMKEYTKSRFTKKGKEAWDPTTQKIYNYMIENNQSELEIFVVQAPRTTTTIKSFVTGKSYNVQIETAEELEQTLIQEAMRAGEDLPMCRETLK